MATVDAGNLELVGVALWEPAEVDELRGAASAIPWRQARSSLIGARLAWMPGRLPPNGLCERLKRLMILAFKAFTIKLMKTKLTRQASTELPRFIVGALATAGGAAQAATVQITFANSFVSASSSANLVTDVGGDGFADLTGQVTTFSNSIGRLDQVNLRIFPVASIIGRARAGYSVNSAVWEVQLKAGTYTTSNPLFRNPNITMIERGKVSFATDVEGLVGERFGWLDLRSSFINGEVKVEVLRYVFDDAAVTAPAYSNSATYPEYVAAVPEPGSNLALLALGAGGLTLRRRLKRAA
jgi:hypothetical protein